MEIKKSTGKAVQICDRSVTFLAKKGRIGLEGTTTQCPSECERTEDLLFRGCDDMFKDGSLSCATNTQLVRIFICVQRGRTSFYETNMTCHNFLAPKQNKQA